MYQIVFVENKQLLLMGIIGAEAEIHANATRTNNMLQTILT